MTAWTKADYEQFLLSEIRELAEYELAKILKLIHFVKEEIFQTENAKKSILKYFWRVLVAGRMKRRLKRSSMRYMKVANQPFVIFSYERICLRYGYLYLLA